ncbi:MAG: hypothetical protein K2X91_05760 [Thermoleophilia bacterium]|nr:hypothetical protein [Thermoleophilia bacterium]
MGQGSDRIDWSKAGTRLRRTEPKPSDGGRNPDWNWPAKRWKTAEEYAGEEMTPDEVVARVACPRTDCPGDVGLPCRSYRDEAMDYPHAERRAAAGAARIEAGEFTL